MNAITKNRNLYYLQRPPLTTSAPTVRYLVARLTERDSDCPDSVRPYNTSHFHYTEIYVVTSHIITLTPVSYRTDKCVAVKKNVMWVKEGRYFTNRNSDNNFVYFLMNSSVYSYRWYVRPTHMHTGDVCGMCSTYFVFDIFAVLLHMAYGITLADTPL